MSVDMHQRIGGKSVSMFTIDTCNLKALTVSTSETWFLPIKRHRVTFFHL